MKNLKFVVAVMGFTIATICSANKAHALAKSGELKECRDGGLCGSTPDGCAIVGQPHTI